MRAVAISFLICFIIAAACPSPAPAADSSAGTPSPAPGAMPVSGAGAMSPTPAPSAPPAAYIYTVRPGDTLRITTAGEQMYSGLFRVGADGSVQFHDQMIAQVSLGGLTLEQAQSRLVERLSRFVRNLAVVVELARFTVIVTGAVRSPGQYEMDSGSLVMEAVTRAGFGSAPAPPPAAAQPAASAGQPPAVFVAPAGASLDDLERVYLRRATGEMRTLDLRAYIEKGDLSQNIALMPGDTVAVGFLGAPPERAYRVSGAVRTPGRFWLPREGQIRVQDALQSAGGLTEEADLQHCTVLHPNGSRSGLDLTQLERNPALGGIGAGDELIVPRYPVSIQVIGAVNKPGRYRVPEQTTCLDAVTLAGGFVPDAILQDTCVVRGQPPVRMTADLQKTLKGADMKQNLVLRDGDVLFIPRRNPPGSSGSSWSAVASTLSILRWLIP